MRAAVVRAFGSPDCIKILSSNEIPKIEEAGQILIKVKTSGINPVDTYIRSGQYGVLPKLPYTPGRDGAGIIEEVDSSITHLKKGNRIWFLSEGHGSAAEFTVSRKVFLLPDNLSFAEGAALGVPYLTAYRALFIKGELQPNSRILIHGASGGVGLAACQLAAWKGHSVIGTAGTAEGCKIVGANGASEVYNHKEAGYLENLRAKHSSGFDLIVEMAAHINLASDLTLLSKNGRIAVVGNRGPIEINPRFLMTMESSIYGIALTHSTPEECQYMANDINSMFTQTNYRPIVHREYPLENIAQAHIDIMNNKGSLGNLIINL